MSVLADFWRQPCRRYRNFQIVFTVLTLNFVIPAASYAIAPELAMEQFGQVNDALGGERYGFPEAESRVWRYLGAANVMTLGLMCFLLQLNLRRFRPVLLPLAFLKGYNATLYLFGWAAAPRYPGLAAVAVLDFVTTWAFIHFARRAYREIDGQDDALLVPRPR